MFTMYLWLLTKTKNMLRNFLLAVFSLGLFLMISCNTEVKKRADYKSVMEVHDIAMAKMGEIHDLKKQLREWNESSQDSLLLDTSNSLISDLDNADEGMMSWMAEFRIPKDASEDQLSTYFASEQTKVDQVSEDIDQAISGAKEFLKNK